MPKIKVYRQFALPQCAGETPEQRLQALQEWAAVVEPGRQFTAEELSRVSGITRQGILVIQNRALKKLRRRVGELREYLV